MVRLYDLFLGIPEIIATAWRHTGITVRGAWLHDPLPARTSAHPHHWQIWCVQAGAVTATTGVDQRTWQAGDMCLLDPGRTIHLQPATARTVVADVLFSAIASSGHQVPWAKLTLPAVIPDVEASDIVALSEDMADNRWHSAAAAMYARFLIDQILWREIARGYALGAIRGDRMRPQWLQDCIAAADAHLHDPDFNVPALVRLSGSSHGHFCRTVRRYDGCTPSGLLRQLRVQRAGHMLGHDPAVPIDEIVDRCGFGSATRYRRQWREERQAFGGTDLTVGPSICTFTDHS